MHIEKRFTCPNCGGWHFVTAHGGDMSKALHFCTGYTMEGPCRFECIGDAIEQYLSPVTVHDERTI